MPRKLNQMKLFFITLLGLLHFQTFGFNVDDILKQERIKVERIDLMESDKVTFISSDFAQPQITSIGLRSKILNLEIYKVYYVYTAYKRSESFDQLKLDKHRFAQLELNYPELFKDPNFDWEIIEQTGLFDHKRGADFFHGFILVHRPVKTEESRQKELDELFHFLDNPSEFYKTSEIDPIAEILNIPSEEEKTDSLSETGYKGGDQALSDHIKMNFNTPDDVWKNRKDFWAKFDLILDENGEVESVEFKENYGKDTEKSIEKMVSQMDPWEIKKVNGTPMKDTVNFEMRVSYSPQLKGMYLKNGQPPTLNHTNNNHTEMTVEEKRKSGKIIMESPLFNSLNLLKDEEDMTLLVDVTGSMSTNIAAIKFWLKMNEKKFPFTHFILFNDGDDKKDHEKKEGSTGGIYLTKFYSEFNETVRTAMTNGNGGDFPENDIEAILYAQRKNPRNKNYLLIADNMSNVKDYGLLNKVEGKVSIIPCSLNKYIHQHYLNIVYRTGGKIYYNGEAFNLSEMKRNDKIKIKKQTYIFNGKQVVPKYK